jgi:hypothetical protein
VGADAFACASGSRLECRLPFSDSRQHKAEDHAGVEIRETKGMQLHKIWSEQCEAARGIEDDFGTQKALAYLVGESS